MRGEGRRGEAGLDPSGTDLLKFSAELSLSSCLSTALTLGHNFYSDIKPQSSLLPPAHYTPFAYTAKFFGVLFTYIV